MKILCLLLLSLFLIPTVHAGAISAQDEKIAAKEILQNIALDRASKAKDQTIKSSLRLIAGIRIDTDGDPGDCHPHGPGPDGGNGCWDACTTQGYGASYCVSLCGVASSSASGSCWDSCTKQGYGSSYCAPLCGTSTSGGSAECWNSCSTQGYGASYCIGVCGVSTEGGKNACWASCSKQGYGASYCSSLCGNP